MKTTTDLPTGTWTLDQTTTITVTATKMGLFSIPATLRLTSGTVEIDDDHRVVGIEVVADTASYASKNAKRNEHVIGGDFLDTGSHPTITFVASSVSPTADGYRADGTVTVKGTAAAMAVTIADVTVEGTAASFTATATVDRTAVGVSKMPTFVIGRDLTISVSARATLT